MCFVSENIKSAVDVLCTFSLTRIAEHCRGTPIILWGFHVTELALQNVICAILSQKIPINNNTHIHLF